jgi:undecaprenyl diphosphate synthase
MKRDFTGINIPKHIAIILDGNGRWAKKRGLPRKMGHVEGCKVVEKTVENAANIGIDYLTVYGFSTENWKRSEDEVNALMQLFRYYISRLLKVAKVNNVKVISIGDRSRFANDIVKGLNKLESETQNATGLTFVLAINYGSRDEITRAIKNIAKDIKEDRIQETDISEELVSKYLDTKGIPDPDLLIRTGGNFRISNYLLWQCAYTEFYITDTFWPDFNIDELYNAILSYNGRERRFGGILDK